MSRGRSKKKYCPELDSSDTDSDFSEDTPPSPSPNRSPEVVSKTRGGCDENVSQGGSYTAGISVGNVSEVKSLCTAGDVRNQQMTSEKPYGYYFGSLDKARKMLMGVCVPDTASNTEATSSGVVNVADRRPGKLFSVGEYSGDCSNHGFAHSIKSKSIKDLDRLPPKYKCSEQSISQKSERVEKRTHELPKIGKETASTLSQDKQDFLNEMKTNLSKQGRLTISKNVTDRDGTASSSANGDYKTFTFITNEIAAVTKNFMGVRGSAEIGEQKKCSNAFQPLNQLDHGTRQKSAEKQNALSVVMREHNLPQAVITKTDVYAGKNKEQGFPNQNLSSGQLKSTETYDEAKICSEQCFKFKEESETIGKSAKPVEPLTGNHIAESNSAERQVSRNSSLIKSTSKSTALQGNQFNRKCEDLLTPEVERLKETLGNTQNQRVTTCIKPEDTGIQNLISAKITSDKHAERNIAGVDKIAGRCIRQSSHQQQLLSSNIEGKSHEEPPLTSKSAESVDLSLFTESPLKTVSKLSTSKSMQEFHQNLYVVHLLEKINPYNVEQLLQTSFEKLFSSVEQSLKVKTGCVFLPWWNLYNNARAIFVEFKTAVEVVEQNFKHCTCFPDADLSKTLQTLQEFNTKIPPRLPLSIRKFVDDQIKVCIKGYESRNTFTREGEFKAYTALVKVAADHYFDEMQFVVGDKYYGNNWLFEKHQEVFQETARHFLSAASFRHLIWERKYTGQLRDLLNSKYNEIQLIHIENRKILETKLAQIKLEMASICQNSLLRKITNQSLLASEYKFDELGRAWKKESVSQFDVAIQEKIGSQYEVEIFICRNQFERICDDIVKRERNNWVFQRDKARAARLKKKEEQECKDKEKLERVVEKQEKDKKERETRKVTYQTPQNSASTKHNYCSHQKQGTTSSATNILSRFNSFSAGIDHFPLIDIAIYFGLSRTLVGIIKPQTDEFQLLADVENCLYFENHQLVAFSEEEKIKFGHGKGTSFACQVIQHSLDRVYDIEINGVKRPFRNEDFISFLFSAIKWHIEMKFGIRVSHSCVICLPQCFNEFQCQVVLVGAKIAGFGNVAFINDTNAMAMSCMIRNNILNETIIAVNSSEGFLDAGLFQVQNAFISTTAVAGHHFQQKRSFWINYSYTFRSFFESLKPETLSDMLSFNGIITPRYFRKEAIIVVGSDAEIAERVTSFYGLDASEMRTPYYIIEGAAILAALYDPESVLRQRWERMGNSKAFPSSWGKFLQNLQCEYVKYGMKSLNKKKGSPLKDDAYKMRKQNFFFQGKATFHERKMKLVNKCRQMKKEVSNKEVVSECGELDVTLVLGKLFSIEDAIRRTDINTSELMDIEKRLIELFARVYSMEC